MIAAIETPFGHGIPPYTPHSITVHAPGWITLEKFVNGDPAILSQLKSLYPRFGPYNQTKELVGFIVTKLPVGSGCLIFPNRSSAEACRAFVISEERGEEAADPSTVSIKAFDFHVRIYATVFPAEKSKLAIKFWQDPGTAVSTRLAEDCLKHVDQVKEVDPNSQAPSSPDTPSHEILRSRIVGLLERAPVTEHTKKVSPDDVYLYQTGMAAIYLSHLHLSMGRPGTTILYGFAFHSTFHVFERFGSNGKRWQWFKRGGDEDIDALEQFVDAEKAAGRSIQALWTEFPTNPNLITPNVGKLRALADKHSFPLIVDDTIGSFANIDLLGDSGADALMSSLTKSFSGYADVMGGSLVLNPASKHYVELKETFEKHYVNDLYSADADVLEKNSRDYLQRTAILNRNALSLATFLAGPAYEHQISRVLYPPSNPSSKANYDLHLRPATAELENPGYGCLLSIEFKKIEQAIAFYDNIPLHCGPHLGAHRTLVVPYSRLMALQSKDPTLLSEGGMSDRMIRISVGLEDEADLIEAVTYTLGKVDEIVKEQETVSDPVEEVARLAASTAT